MSGFRVFAPAHPNLTGVKTVAGDYDLKQLGVVMDKKSLVADIVSTWIERGEDRQTICFAVNRTHAKNIEMNFREVGVSAEYMDAFTPIEERREIFKRFKNGDTRIICNVGVLTTGFDADVRCIILARPTKSEILYTQMIGRGLRTAEGKDHCLILDHSDTTLRLGFVTDINRTELDDGSAKKSSKTVKKELLPKECPKCSALKPPKVRKCLACGFEPQLKASEVEVHEGQLHEITRSKKQKVRDWSPDKKQEFYSELLLHAYLRGYKEGWAYYAYKDKLGSFPPNTLKKVHGKFVSLETTAWIKHYNIKKARAKYGLGRAA